MLTALGVLLGMLLVVGVVLFLTGPSIWLPALARCLENNPKNPNRFAATTKVGPGRFKFVMKGGKVVCGLMNYAGYKQKGGIQVPDTFEAVPLAQGETQPKQDRGIIDDTFFRYTGYRFINPFSERIYTYDFPRADEVLMNNGELEVVGIPNDRSDYFSLTEQTYPLSIINTDTGGGENIKVSMKGKVTFKIFNPHKAAFAEKKWLQQAIAAIRVRGRNFARTRDFDTLLGKGGAINQALKDAIGLDLAKVSTEIEGGVGSEELWGVRVTRVLIETIDMTDEKAEASRTAKYTAQRQAEVMGIATAAEAKRKKDLRAADAEAEANYIATVADATVAQGALGLKMMDQQTQIAMAKGAGTTILNVGGAGNEISPMDAAILEELKKGNRPTGTTSQPTTQKKSWPKRSA